MGDSLGVAQNDMTTAELRRNLENGTIFCGPASEGGAFVSRGVDFAEAAPDEVGIWWSFEFG